MDQAQSTVLKNEILPYLAPSLGRLILSNDNKIGPGLEEIRLRCGQPLVLRVGDDEYTINPQGQLDQELKNGYRVKPEELARTLASLSDNSLYAFEEEIRKGFLTIPGGHRVGLAGQVVMRDGQVHGINGFSSVAIRIAREIKGCSHSLLPRITENGSLINTLLVSAPRCGKTTILRDLVRVFSSGYGRIAGCNVTVVDERSEIAGCYRAIPQMDLGPRTDVLDACPKAFGMMMAIRSLSPTLIVTDELGRREDLEAIRECINAGVDILASVHARNIEEMLRREVLEDLIKSGIFRRVVILSRRNGPGTVEEVIRWGEK